MVPTPHIGSTTMFERSERLVEGAAELGELIEGGRLDPTGVEMTHNQAVTFSPSERLGEHLVGNAVQPRRRDPGSSDPRFVARRAWRGSIVHR